MNDDSINRQDAINKCQERLYESALNNVGYECKADEVFADIAQNRIKTWLNEVPSAQPEDWMERNKERILQAGMEGREVEFYIGGRLFAIREIAQ